jgi:hypothetical protein
MTAMHRIIWHGDKLWASPGGINLARIRRDIISLGSVNIHRNSSNTILGFQTLFGSFLALSGFAPQTFCSILTPPYQYHHPHEQPQQAAKYAPSPSLIRPVTTMAGRQAFVVPALKKQTATVLMLHGLGDRSANIRTSYMKRC